MGDSLPRDDYRVEILRADLLEQAAQFLQDEGASGLSKEEWLAKFRVFWEKNPFFDERSHARGWVVIDKTGGVVGFLGNVPTPYVRRGVKEAGYWATTWYVAERARPYSLPLFRSFISQNGVLFNTTPTPGVELILEKRFKFTKLSAQWLAVDYLLPLRVSGCANYLRWRLSESRVLKRFSLPAAAVLMTVISVIAFARRPRRLRGVEVREVSTLPADTESWWREYQKQHTYTLSRDERTMQWLFYTDAFSKSRKVLEVRHNAELLGFLSLKLSRQPTWAAAELADFALTTMREEVVAAAILGMRHAARSWGKDIAHVRANAFSEAMGRLLTRTGAFKLKGKARFYYLDKKNDLAPGEVGGSPIDGDRGLFP